MVRLESFGGEEGAGASGRLKRNAKGRTRRFGLDTGRSVLNWFNPYIHRGEVQVKKRRVQSVVLLQLVHILGKEQEGGRRVDIVRVLVLELHELVVQG